MSALLATSITVVISSLLVLEIPAKEKMALKLTFVKLRKLMKSLTFDSSAHSKRLPPVQRRNGVELTGNRFNYRQSSHLYAKNFRISNGRKRHKKAKKKLTKKQESRKLGSCTAINWPKKKINEGQRAVKERVACTVTICKLFVSSLEIVLRVILIFFICISTQPARVSAVVSSIAPRVCRFGYLLVWALIGEG